MGASDGGDTASHRWGGAVRSVYCVPLIIPPQPVNVFALTLLVSLCLAGIFIVSFACEMRRNRERSLERESLLPLDD